MVAGHRPTFQMRRQSVLTGLPSLARILNKEKIHQDLKHKKLNKFTRSNILALDFRATGLKFWKKKKEYSSSFSERAQKSSCHSQLTDTHSFYNSSFYFCNLFIACFLFFLWCSWNIKWVKEQDMNENYHLISVKEGSYLRHMGIERAIIKDMVPEKQDNLRYHCKGWKRVCRWNNGSRISPTS